MTEQMQCRFERKEEFMAHCKITDAGVQDGIVKFRITTNIKISKYCAQYQN